MRKWLEKTLLPIADVHRGVVIVLDPEIRLVAVLSTIAPPTEASLPVVPPGSPAALTVLVTAELAVSDRSPELVIVESTTSIVADDVAWTACLDSAVGAAATVVLAEMAMFPPRRLAPPVTLTEAAASAVVTCRVGEPPVWLSAAVKVIAPVPVLIVTRALTTIVSATITRFAPGMTRSSATVTVSLPASPVTVSEAVGVTKLTLSSDPVVLLTSMLPTTTGS